MNDFINSRPQRLCKMCGTCCRVVALPKSYKELQELAKNGDKEAMDFLELFEPYLSVDEARKVSPETVDNILEYYNEDCECIFYKCRFILDNNLCSRYENRKEVCNRFPSTAWAVAPPGCGYEGWLFQKKEEIKQYVRRKKECKLEFEAMLKETDDSAKIEKLLEGIKKIDCIIEMFSKYGSKDW